MMPQGKRNKFVLKLKLKKRDTDFGAGPGVLVTQKVTIIGDDPDTVKWQLRVAQDELIEKSIAVEATPEN